MQERHGERDLRRFKSIKKCRKLSYKILLCKKNGLQKEENSSIITEDLRIKEEI